jgi:hypothetical protein
VPVVFDTSMIFWRAVDRLDYWIWYVRLRITDALYGLQPETEADWQRNGAE